MNQPKEEAWVSFCMTTFKRPDFLRKQLQIILKQSFTRWELIISDNDPQGSGKSAVDEVNDPRISYAINEANLGMIKSFNRSLAKAGTEFIIMITDDDPVYPDMLQILYDLSIQYPGYGMYMGGCDIQCSNPLVARSSRLRVGTNSCLADLAIGTVRKFKGTEFPFSYFRNELGAQLLWSAGIVRREIALAIGGVPDFGAPFNGDFAYIVLSASYAGAVLINTSVACQVVHGANYGFTESDFEKFYITPDAFIGWIKDHLPPDFNYGALKKDLETFTGRWVVEFAVSMKKYIRGKGISERGFNQIVRKIFRIPYLQKWKWKYLLAIYFPGIFKLMISLKERIYKKK
jgi:glycosyltransferase involved in cell wall biosynthesis